MTTTDLPRTPGATLARTARRDPIAQVALAWLLTVAVLPFLPWSKSTLEFLLGYGTDVLVLITLVAILVGRGRLQRNERLFWNDLSFAFGAWIAATVLLMPYGYKPAPLKLSLVVELCYGLYYIGLVMAVERTPYREEARRLTGLRRMMRWPAITAFVIGLYAYFAVIPAFLNRPYYDSFVPHFYLYMLLDGYLTIRLILIARQVRQQRWQVLYRLFALACALTFVTDVQGLLTYSLLSGKIAQLFVWKLPLVAFVFLARSREQLPEVEELEEAPRVLTASHGETLSFALLLPLIHFLAYNLGFLDDPSRVAREWMLVVWLVLLGSVALVQYRILERSRDELAAGKDELAEELAWRAAAEAERERLIAALEERNAEMERFTYSVAHDLRTPIFTIHGFTGLLQHALDEDEARRFGGDLETIREAADTMRRHLDDLLNLLQYGAGESRVEEVALNELVDETLAAYADRVGEAEVHVETLPRVQGDRRRLLEVVENLIDNALRYTNGGQRPRIEIGVRGDCAKNTKGTKGPCTVVIRDNGRGIDPRYLERVFKLFERLDADNQGTGVGLALARRIIEHHGGEIWAESEGLGRGSAFCFTLGTASPS